MRTPLLVYDLDIESANNIFSNVEKAIDDRDYERAVEFATSSLGQIQQQHLVTILDHRAYVLGMQGHFDEAVKAAKSIVTMTSKSSTGYLRLGQLYQQQGKPQLAIDTYSDGVRNVSHSDKDYQSFRRFSKEAAMQASKKVDVIAALPAEMAYAILCHLPKQSIIACLDVSQIWRLRSTEYSIAWTSLSVNGSEVDHRVANVLPQIACHVEQLTINTRNRKLWRQYSQHMQDGYFLNIKSLTVGGSSPIRLARDLQGSMITTFNRISATLTTLTLNFGSYLVKSPTIADVLINCDNLRTLKYITLAALSDVLGNLAARRKKYLLVDLHLRAKDISGPVAKRLLHRCQQIRRLILQGCKANVLNVIKQNCPNLEVLGYNPYESTPLPSLDQTHGEGSSSGLRVIDSVSGTSGIPTEDVMLLLAENSETLESIEVDLRPQTVPYFFGRYAGLRLNNLKSLVYDADLEHESVEEIVLQSISSNTKLKRFCARGTSGIGAIAATLANLPPVEAFWLDCTSEHIINEEDLIRLFQHYATTQQTSAQLKEIGLGQCLSITDGVLYALAQVQSLTSIVLYELDSVSAGGLQAFLEGLGSHVSEIDIDMSITNDRHLEVFSRMQGLKKLTLKSLTDISDHGIINMVNKTKSMKTLELHDCITISDKAIKDASQIISVKKGPGFD